MRRLDILKAFAGPVATIIASSAAVWVTVRFGTIQAAIAGEQTKIAEAQKEIAKSQRDIAYDKLKFDLFDKRYEIYRTAKNIIERIVQTGVERRIDDPELLTMRIKLAEAQFFFPSKGVSLFENIDKLAENHEVARSFWERSKENDELRVKWGDEMAAAVEKLIAIYRLFPGAVKDELGFSLLIDPHR